MTDLNEVAKAGYEWMHTGSRWETAQSSVQGSWIEAAKRARVLAAELRALPEQLSHSSLGQFAQAGYSGSDERWVSLSREEKDRWQKAAEVMRDRWDELEG